MLKTQKKIKNKTRSKTSNFYYNFKKFSLAMKNFFPVLFAKERGMISIVKGPRNVFYLIVEID